ncbi:PHP domain-containing protein [Chloroflexota bacterium]
MRIDLHIHTRTGSDGALSIEEVLREAKKRGLDLMSITDHDSIDCQERAITLAKEYGILYVTGVELNVTFQYNGEKNSDMRHQEESGEQLRLPKSVSLDFLGYQYGIGNQELGDKIELMRKHREDRARQILEKLNVELYKEGMAGLTEEDMKKIEGSVDGAFGRPHIARYLVVKGIVGSIQEAFDKYLVRCDVPKYPLALAEASRLVRNAGGKLILAHPNDPHGTSLVSITGDLDEQADIIEEYMLEYIDGVECWHSRHDEKTTTHYIEFARKHGLLMTGGSDCHQKPVIMGTLDIPDYVAEQFQL